MKHPKLRDDLALVEQVYRGEHSYVVKDHAAQKYFRFKPLEVFVMQQLDGEKSASEVASVLAEQGLPFKASAVAAFARKLDGMGLLEKTVAEKSVLQMERLRAERTRRVKGSHYQGSILRMRWPMGDPDQALNRWAPKVAFFFSKPFLAVSAVLFVVYAAVLVNRWPQLSAQMAVLYSPSQYTLGFVATFWFTALVIVAVHELGHAFTCKRFGGEVHEMGFMLVYFQPAFYCNVNDAWTFPEKKARLWVTAAGSWIQMVVAALAAIVWSASEPGTLLSQVAFVSVLFAGVATVVANANPLLPLDGYYALSDWLEVPNLRKRAFTWVGWWLKARVLRLAVPEPDATDREKRVFAIYGVLAFVYSTMILSAIALRLFGWVSRELGLLASVAFLLLVWRSLRKRFRGLAQAVVTAVREHRSVSRGAKARRALGALLVLAALMVIIPWPIVVRGRFVAMPQGELSLGATEDALVSRVLVQEGTLVPAGAPLVILRSPRLEVQALAAARRRDSLEARAFALRAGGLTGENRVVAELLRAAVRDVEAVGARVAALTLRAPLASVVATPRPAELVGRRFERGDAVVALQAMPDTVELAVALDKAGAVLVRPGQMADVVPLSDVGDTRELPVLSVSSSARAGGSADATARIRVHAQGAYRPGVTGEAKIAVRQSSLLGAVWWGIRKRFKSDLLL